MNLERRGDAVVLHPPAKLNLFLEVLFRREDGFHELETVFHAIDLCDELRVERVAGVDHRFAARGRPVETGVDNLVVRAAEAFFSARPPRFGLKTDLTKSIPLGAGLGGGSADAAGMLLALNALADDPLPPAKLSAIGATLGSDVPFFFSCGTAVGRGRGEQIEPIEAANAPDLWFVVLYPGVPAPTPVVYRGLTLDLKRPRKDLRRFTQTLGQPWKPDSPPFHNALTEPFRKAFPELAALQDRVSRATGRRFTVSGSGSSLFVAMPSKDEADEVRGTLQAMAAGESFVCRSLVRRPGAAR